MVIFRLCCCLYFPRYLEISGQILTQFFLLPGKIALQISNRRLGKAQSRHEGRGEKKVLLLLQGNEVLFLGGPAHSLIHIRTDYM